MKGVSIKRARETLDDLIDRVVSGERVNIIRGSKIVAQLVPPEPARTPAPSMEGFRNTIKINGKPLSKDIIDARRKERG